MTTRLARYLFNSIRNRIPTRYSGYKATNYVIQSNPKSQLKDFPGVCQEIENIIANPSSIVSSISHKISNISHEIVSPFLGHPVIGRYSYCSDKDLRKAFINYQMEEINKKSFDLDSKSFDLDSRIDCFFKIADLIEGKYWNKMIASTIVGQGKTIYEAEIDCVGELVDLLRFNVQYVTEIINKQPISTMTETNISQYLPMRGFMTAITPFNFTAIAANLSLTPLLFGNTVFWKPSEKALLSNRLFYDICLEAGIPSSLLKFIVMEPKIYGTIITEHPELSGLLFTGSNQTFMTLYKNIMENMDQYNNYPRIVGETGGKNFHFADSTADVKLLAKKTFEAAFGYSGQKCSACSRLYLPEELYDDFMNEMLLLMNQVSTYHYSVIDKQNYDRIKNILEDIKKSPLTKIVMGGKTNDEETYYIEPTIFISENGNNQFMTEEFFGPILGIRLYSEMKNIINECVNCTQYALTGAIFSQDEIFIEQMSRVFENSCGNFYINDGCTKAVVGRQPFGGLGLSGTNDKVGDINFLFRLFNQRNIKIAN